ncbi:PhzF family phenazine biosynthesis protein [Photorhabdus stackebrandtii]|uniref:Phenazine biosynthesis protein PhzF n=1 Tax=Photorhabdus stackebrandtii TaxID=1123042 RepID=A0A7X5TKW6_9GAMM|nr:PhzF family phenazine biosynthesis protein [Photorhabdus stackebrandtii]NHB97411.1 phenazine biosynthesis protein PhzF [Photorhabdus stackebrandtii]
MPEVNFRQIDVFTSQLFKGNPVAVVMDAHELSTEQMQSIANWMNLSETTFVLPSENPLADYCVRIFTPSSELPFAGHPTIGTAYALLEAGIIEAHDGRVVQECGAGLINLTVTTKPSGNISVAFELPEPVITPLSIEQIERLECILGCPFDRSLTPALVDVGARWIVAQTRNIETLLHMRPDYTKLQEHDRDMNVTGSCIYGVYPDMKNMQIEVRSFAPACGVNEDPVCGSGNGSVAAFIRYHRVNVPADGMILSSQGRILGRDGKLELHFADGKITVGGSAVTCITGIIKY